MKAFIQYCCHRKKITCLRKKKQLDSTFFCKHNNGDEEENVNYTGLFSDFTVFLSALCLCEHLHSDKEIMLQYRIALASAQYKALQCKVILSMYVAFQ